MSNPIGALKVPLVAAGDTTPGAVLTLLNDTAYDRIVTALFIDIITESNNPATVDAGVSGETVASSDNLLDECGISGGPEVLSNHNEGGTNGRSAVKWPSGHYLTITASTDLDGFTGNAYLDWIYA
jgi:hypothetical protein